MTRVEACRVCEHQRVFSDQMLLATGRLTGTKHLRRPVTRYRGAGTGLSCNLAIKFR